LQTPGRSPRAERGKILIDGTIRRRCCPAQTAHEVGTSSRIPTTDLRATVADEVAFGPAQFGLDDGRSRDVSKKFLRP